MPNSLLGTVFNQQLNALNIESTTSTLQLAKGLLSIDNHTTGQNLWTMGRSSGLVERALQSAENQLRAFVTDPAFVEKMNVAFGNSWDRGVVRELTQSWLHGNFSALPKLEIRSGAEINNANGAFAAQTNTIYLSNNFLSQNASNVKAVTAVLLEEIGHAIDIRINKTDAAGDEGDIFSRLVRGEKISASELLQLKTENDHAIVTINGKATEIEMSQIAMVSLNGKIYQSHQGLDNRIYTRSSTDGVNWTAWNNNGGGETPSAPTLTALNGRLYQSTRGMDNKIYTRSSTDGVNWTGWNNNGGGDTPSAPTLTALNGRLYQSHRGLDNKIYTRSSTDGVNWTAWNNNGGGETPDAPSLTVSNGRLYQAHQGLDNKIYTRSSTDGANWTGWVEKGGLTPTETSKIGVWRATYYNNANLSDNFVFERTENTINYNWVTGSPDSRINQDNFSVRWEGQFQFDAGKYTFKPNVDDGVRIWIDGQLVRDAWNSPSADNFQRDMAAGLHTIKVEYRELGGNAYAQFSWDKTIVNIPSSFAPPPSNATEFKALAAFTTDNPFWKSGYAPSSLYSDGKIYINGSLGNCTWYANGRLRQLGYSSSALNKLTGNASQWDDQAKLANIPISNKPQVGAIAQWESNHVAVVEEVKQDGSIRISESSYWYAGNSYLIHTDRIVKPNANGNWDCVFILVPKL